MSEKAKILAIGADSALMRGIIENIEAGGCAVDYICDAALIDTQAVSAAAEEIGAKYDKLIIDLFTPQEFAHRSIEQLTEEEWLRYKYRTVTYMYDIGRFIVKGQVKQGLDIIILTSAGGDTPVRGSMLTCGGDASAMMFAKVMAEELAPLGVTVNCIAVGLDGELGISAADERTLIEHIPAKRKLDKGELCREIAALCMEKRYAATGNIIRLDDAFCVGYMRDY